MCAIFVVEERAGGRCQIVVKMQARTGFVVERFGHEGHRLAVTEALVLDDILHQHGLISHLQERSEFDLELVLTSTSDLVVMVLHSHTSVSQQRGDLIAQIIRAVLRRRGVVTLLISDLVAKLIGLSRVDLAPFL